MLLYDNLDDCKSKLSGTIVYYKGQACYVKDVTGQLDPTGQFYKTYTLKLSFPDRRNLVNIDLADKDLNYLRFNLGYANTGAISVYWYRNPIKQYKQGLKADQLGYRTSKDEIYDIVFSLNPVYINMLEDKYPTIGQCLEYLKDKRVYNYAFCKDFAIAYDDIHNDYIFEYKGTKIGYSPNLNNINLLDKFAYLKESLMETIHVQ